MKKNGRNSGKQKNALAGLEAAKSMAATKATITKTLRDAVRFLGADLGFLPSEVSARSLRAAGATALLVANVDPDVIRLLGRWRSDEMLRYLHLSAEPVMRRFASQMLQAEYTLAPHQLAPLH